MPELGPTKFSQADQCLKNKNLNVTKLKPLNFLVKYSKILETQKNYNSNAKQNNYQYTIES